MAERLVALAASVKPLDNMYLNAQRAALFAKRLAQAKRDNAPSKMGIRMEYANELMLAGKPRDAIEEFTRARNKLSTLRGTMSDAAFTPMWNELQRMLTLSWLRVGETENCLDHAGAEGCLFPITAAGVHRRREGSDKARELLLDTLARDPEDWSARWLLNVVCMTLGEYPDGVPAEALIPPEAFEAGADTGRHRDVAEAVGLDARGLAGGVCIEDFDGDERLDVMVSSWGLTDPLRFFHNSGDGTFEERAAGLTGLVGGLNLLHGDYDGDGDSDVLVLRGAWFETDGGHPNSLLRNDGHGNFEDVTEAAGLLSFHPTQAAVFADLDGDGDLDLFIGNETSAHEVHPCELFENQGDGTFRETAAAVPVAGPTGPLATGLAIEGYVKAVAAGDVDDDGRVDLYLSRIDGENLLLRNLGAGVDGESADGGPPGLRFEEIGVAAGVSEPFRSFPAWFFDHDGDGRDDIFVSGFRYGSAGWVAQDYLGLDNRGVKPRLFRNRGDLTFEDRTIAAGLDGVFLTMGSNHGDLDGDGFADIYLGTGEPEVSALFPNRMFLNDGDGGFLDVTSTGGFGHLQKGHGIAFADVDNDGDQDIYAVMGGAYSGDVARNVLFENPGHGSGWVTLRLRGTTVDRSAVGARVALDVRDPDGSMRSVHATVGTGGSFGATTLRCEIGLGAAVAIETARVRWPGRAAPETFTGVQPGAAWSLTEGRGRAEPLALPGMDLAPPGPAAPGR